MTAVYLIRHPETTWNLAQRYQGRLESPLSPGGIVQSRRLQHAFREAHLDEVYASPLIRAHGLAAGIAQVAHAPLRIDQRLTEMAQGPWEGLLLHQIEALYGRLYRRWYTTPHRVAFPGGESLNEVRDRAQSVLREIVDRYPAGQVVVVTHAVVIQTMAACALTVDLQHIHHIRISNCAVTTICAAAAPGQVLTLNSTDALYGSPQAAAEQLGCSSHAPRRLTT